VLIGPLKALAVALVVLASTAVAPAPAPATPASAPATPASAARTPTRTVVIGHSVKGRRIIAIVRGPTDAPRKILLVGCIHGNECAGVAIISALERAPVGEHLHAIDESHDPVGLVADEARELAVAGSQILLQ